MLTAHICHVSSKDAHKRRKKRAMRPRRHRKRSQPEHHYQNVVLITKYFFHAMNQMRDEIIHLRLRATWVSRDNMAFQRVLRWFN